MLHATSLKKSINNFLVEIEGLWWSLDYSVACAREIACYQGGRNLFISLRRSDCDFFERFYQSEAKLEPPEILEKSSELPICLNMTLVGLA